MSVAVQLLELLPEGQAEDNGENDDSNGGGGDDDDDDGNNVVSRNHPPPSETSTIPRRNASQLTYNEFYWNYMKRNWPVLLTGTSTDWECRRNWTKLTSDTIADEQADNNEKAKNENANEIAAISKQLTAINFDYLRRRVSDRRVPVADCSTEYFNSHAKSEMHFHTFLDKWQHQQHQQEHSPAAATATTDNHNPNSEQLLYLKDWHLQAQMPDYEFYRVPKHFASDWLNEKLLAHGQDDYRFVYMGPKGTWTPFHSDVFGSFSWSTNIAGRKSWLMLPPGEELKLSDRLRNLPFRIDESLLRGRQVRYFKIEQRENEALFVPSGWYHQVSNATDTISINHNWFNACNIERIWLNLSQTMRQVIAEIADCRQMDDFEGHCQTMLRASFGMNYLDFLDMLEYIAERRLNQATGNEEDDARATFKLNAYHVQYDLRCVRAMAQLLLEDEVIASNRATLYRRCVQLLAVTQQPV